MSVPRAVTRQLRQGEFAEVLPYDRLPGFASRAWAALVTADDGHEYIVAELYEVDGQIVRLDYDGAS